MKFCKIQQWNCEGSNEFLYGGLVHVDSIDIDVIMMNENFHERNVNIAG